MTRLYFKRPAFITLAVLFLPMLIAGCATKPASEAPSTTVSAFSSAAPEGSLPRGWGFRQLSRFKKDTQYRLVADPSGLTVVEATADQSASGLVKHLSIEPTEMPWIHWRWRVPGLIATADNTRRDLEDAPVRVIVTFEGDMSKLDFEERAVASRLKALTGQAMPYATLMYIWENKANVDDIIESPHTSRIKMIVAESGAKRGGNWIDYERNIVRDFEKAFGEKPGRIKSLGIMTDTDNTGERTTAYYGDIRFTTKAIFKENQ
jgi:Protein of unknown function (DUF3047)